MARSASDRAADEALLKEKLLAIHCAAGDGPTSAIRFFTDAQCDWDDLTNADGAALPPYHSPYREIEVDHGHGITSTGLYDINIFPQLTKSTLKKMHPYPDPPALFTSADDLLQWLGVERASRRAASSASYVYDSSGEEFSSAPSPTPKKPRKRSAPSPQSSDDDFERKKTRRGRSSEPGATDTAAADDAPPAHVTSKKKKKKDKSADRPSRVAPTPQPATAQSSASPAPLALPAPSVPTAPTAPPAPTAPAAEAPAAEEQTASTPLDLAHAAVAGDVRGCTIVRRSDNSNERPHAIVPPIPSLDAAEVPPFDRPPEITREMIDKNYWCGIADSLREFILNPNVVIGAPGAIPPPTLGKCRIFVGKPGVKPNKGIMSFGDMFKYTSSDGTVKATLMKFRRSDRDDGGLKGICCIGGCGSEKKRRQYV